MCGIAGLAAKTRNKPISPDICRRMCAAIEHRGPDEEGFWHSDYLSVGMRRLSIIDIDSGSQPIWISRSLGIVFNGEIYNYRQLRDELEHSGIHFTTRSDTEVILRMYQQDGIDFVERLSGMFAICIVDLAKRQLVLARDRFGEKPLYYTDSPRHFVFASELKALLAGLDESPELNTEAVSHYLTLRFVPQPATLWKNVHKLLPGHLLVYDLDEHCCRTKRYWKTEFHAQPVRSRQDYVTQFKDLFYNAVNERILASDVPVGIFLSGGLDSTLITLAAKECGHDSLHTFSIGYDDARFSEFAYAREVAKYFGTKHHEVPYTYDDFSSYITEFPWDSDEPLGDSASIPLRYLSRFARQRVKVTLTGEGADEMFGGYNLETMAQSADGRRSWLAHSPRFLFRLASLAYGPQSERGAAFGRMAREGWGAYVASRPSHPTHFWNDDEKRRLFSSFDRFQPTDDLIRQWYDGIASPEPLDKYMTVLCKSWLVEDLLMKADKMSMRESLELRCPFLDPALAGWAQSLPLDLRFGNRASGYVSKTLLRAFAKGRIPDSIINRPKQGFPVPTYQWIAPNIPRWSKTILEPRDSALRTVLGMDGNLQSTTAAAAAGNEFAVQKIWLLVLLELWLKRWVLNDTCPALFASEPVQMA
ncbi:MAG TPA: asparagine synthase (glutamine-hydrolyzing) [Gammaproteobacteria bacterium]|nr:asparagine synthase (glutamine-hydrolyzing) [Gammaproteobacteria bacterium]